MDTRTQEVQTRYLRGEPVRDIATDMGMSRARVYQLLQLARSESHAHVQVLGISDHIDKEALATYLRKALATAGITPAKGTSE